MGITSTDHERVNVPILPARKRPLINYLLNCPVFRFGAPLDAAPDYANILRNSRIGLVPDRDARDASLMTVPVTDEASGNRPSCRPDPTRLRFQALSPLARKRVLTLRVRRPSLGLSALSPNGSTALLEHEGLLHPTFCIPPVLLTKVYGTATARRALSGG